MFGLRLRRHRDDVIEHEVDGVVARRETNARYEARVREVAAGNIIEATAKARLERTDRHKTRPALELQDYMADDKVDIQ